MSASAATAGQLTRDRTGTERELESSQRVCKNRQTKSQTLGYDLSNALTRPSPALSTMQIILTELMSPLSELLQGFGLSNSMTTVVVPGCQLQKHRTFTTKKKNQQETTKEKQRNILGWKETLKAGGYTTTLYCFVTTILVCCNSAISLHMSHCAAELFSLRLTSSSDPSPFRRALTGDKIKGKEQVKSKKCKVTRAHRKHGNVPHLSHPLQCSRLEGRIRPDHHSPHMSRRNDHIRISRGGHHQGRGIGQAQFPLMPRLCAAGLLKRGGVSYTAFIPQGRCAGGAAWIWVWHALRCVQ
jgi:hypothetical protein